MRKIIVNVLKKINLYNFLIGIKKWLNKPRQEKQEDLNFQKRLEFYSGFLNKNDLVFDVGANIGNRVKVFLQIGCKVVAVEPQKDCISVLKQKFGKNIELVEMGLGDSEGVKKMYVSDANTISSMSEEWIESVRKSRFSQHNWDSTIEINVTSLDKLIEKYGLPRFCKIDVEGYEAEVLRGLNTTIPIISFEYTVPEQMNRLIECVNLCNSLNQNYKFNYTVGEDMRYSLPDYVSFDEFNHIIRKNEFQVNAFGDIYACIMD